MEEETVVVKEEKNVSPEPDKKEEKKSTKKEEPAPAVDAETLEEQKQTKIMKKQLRATRFTNISRIIVLLVVIAMAVMLFPSIIRINNMVTNLDGMVVKVDGIVDNLTELTTELNEVEIAEIADTLQTTVDGIAQIDFEGMSKSLTDTATTAQEGIGDAMGKIDEMDIEGLNSAVKELQTAVKNLNNVTALFRR